jgi:hypothetical protein
MKLQIILATIALLAVLSACLLPAVMKHGKINTARAKHQRIQFRALNPLERLARPFVQAMRELQGFSQRVFAGNRLVACNIAEGVHECSVTRLPDAAIATRHLLYKVGSDADHIAACGVADVPIGTVDDECTAAELATGNHYLTVNLLGHGPTKRMVASEAITAGELVYTAAAGKVQDQPAGATVYLVGVALTAAGADGDILEVASCPPVREVFA